MKLENNRLKFFSWSLTEPKTTDYFTFLLLSIIIMYIGFEQYKIVKDEEQSAMRNALYTIHQNIEQSLKNYYTSTFTLGFTINDEGVPKNFDSIAKKLLQSNHTISTVQLVPKGVLRYIP